MTVMRPLLAILVFVFACTTLPARADFDAGMKAYEAEDYATAFKEWQPLAEAGDARAQYWIGDLYRFGLGMPQNYEFSIQWYRKAASSGRDSPVQLRAIYALAYMVEREQGTERNPGKVECLLRISAEAGYANAQYALSSWLRESWIPFFAGYDWLTRAAAQGDGLALFRLGKINVRSRWWLDLVDPPDYEEGYMYLILASHRGVIEADEILNKIRTGTDEKKHFAYEKALTLARDWRAVPEDPPAGPVRVPDKCLP